MTKRTTPNEEQSQALAGFAARYGAHWKRKLLDMWMNGTDASEPQGHLLRQVRNTYGPVWLQRY